MTSEERHAHWIHFSRQEDTSVTGYVILPQCICSACKQRMNYEKKNCPFCGAIMDEAATIDIEERK